MLLLRYEPTEQNIEKLMHGFIVGAVLIALIVWFGPAMDDLRLGQEFMHPNSIGSSLLLPHFLLPISEEKRSCGRG